ncbi:MAG: hypothetical protein CMP57_03745, partial [Flavobacteriales bacterium]|nr:hypothetical protein [Flavobacteriales bacterium]
MSKDLDNFTGLDADSFERGLHLEGNGSWKPLYPSELERPLKHIEVDYNFKVLSETLTGYRVFPDGQTPSDHLNAEDFSSDPGKLFSLKKQGEDYYWTLVHKSSLFPAIGTSDEGKVLKIKQGKLTWEPDIDTDTFINSTASLNDFPTYSLATSNQVLKVQSGSLVWADDDFQQLPPIANNDGKVLKVQSGSLSWGTDNAASSTLGLSDFPDYNTGDNGSALKVVDGQLEWVDIGAGGLPTIEGNEYKLLTANEDNTKWQSFPGNNHKIINVSNQFPGKYDFSGYNGGNPTVELERGKIYTFDWRQLNQQGGVQHPFRILDIGNETIPAGGYTSADGGQEWGRQRDLETLSPDLVYSTDEFYHQDGTYGYIDPNKISMLNDFSVLQENETEVDITGGLSTNDWWIDETRQVQDSDGVAIGTSSDRTIDPWSSGVILKEAIKRSQGKEIEIEFEYLTSGKDQYFMLGLFKAPNDPNNIDGDGYPANDFNGNTRIVYGFYGQAENIVALKPYNGNKLARYDYVNGDLLWKFDKNGNYSTGENPEAIFEGDEKNPFFPWIRGFGLNSNFYDGTNDYYTTNYPNETPLSPQAGAVVGEVYKVIFTPQEEGCRMEFSLDGEIIRSFLYKYETEENLHLGINFYGDDDTNLGDSLKIKHIKIRNTPFKPSALRSEYIFADWKDDGTVGIGSSDWGGGENSFSGGLLSNRIFDIDAEPELTYTFEPGSTSVRSYHQVGFWDEELYGTDYPGTALSYQNDFRPSEKFRYGVYIQGSNLYIKNRSGNQLYQSIQPFKLSAAEIDAGFSDDYAGWVRQMKPDGDPTRPWHDTITLEGNNVPYLFGDVQHASAWDPSEGFQQKLQINLENKHYQFNNSTLQAADWHYANLSEKPTA